MNSEELEQSLKAEFEDYLKKVFADVQKEMSALEEKIESEFERQKAQLAEAFADFGARAFAADGEGEKELDAGFRASVVEHLRLARDEGARITATAIAEAEAMEKDAAASAPKEAGISELRDGIDDICAQASQAAILKSLVAHAEQFTPRGAFFIVKNEHLVGWRVFGRDEQQENADATVREIFFPVSDSTSLGASIKSLSAVESGNGEYAGDAEFLNKLGFGEPDEAVAVPLVARGRGVAVLYADKGENGGAVNVEALETLVRVAGLTVEVLAAGASPTAVGARQTSVAAPARQASGNTQKESQAEAAPQYSSEENYQSFDGSQEEEASEPEAAAQGDYTAQVEAEGASDYEVAGYAANDYSDAADSPTETHYEAEIIQPDYQSEQTAESYSWNQPAETATEEDSTASEDYLDAGARSGGSGYQFEESPSYDAPVSESENAPVQNYEPAQYEGVGAHSFEAAREDYADAPPPSQASYGAFEPQTDSSAASAATESGFDGKPAQEEVAEVSAAASAKPARSRFSDRNIDLPVEVSEDERRLHNDARRFARLLVSEIKLYNEQKVKEGRDGNDLYDRLREAIDRSREMYDKRVQPTVAAKFDYFHYELVHSLAEGDEAKLGDQYVGAAV